jgi:hypothetical protein
MGAFFSSCTPPKTVPPSSARTWEGIVSKRLSAPYRSDPSLDWIKVKNPDSPAMIRARGAECEDFTDLTVPHSRL